MRSKPAARQNTRAVWKKRFGQLLLLYICLSMAWLAWLEIQSV